MDDGLTKAPGREGLTLERELGQRWGDCVLVGFGGAARSIIPLNNAMQVFF